MWFTIIVIAVLFFLGRKLNNHSLLQGICFTGIFCAATILFSYFLSMHWFIGFVCACVLMLTLMFLAILTAPADSDQESKSIEESLDNLAKSMGSSEGKQNLSNGTADVNSPAVDALIDEVVEVVNDMLEVGWMARIFSEIDYNGLIIATPKYAQMSYNNKSSSTAGIIIDMPFVSDLRNCRHRYPAYDQKPELEEQRDKLDRFIAKYSYCYDSQRNKYVYKTQNRISVPYSKKEIPIEQIISCARLRSEIEQRCPLADFSDNLSKGGTVAFHTKTISH